MNDNDNFPPECQPTANGILLCLGMLADEAMSLNLTRSVTSLRAAIATVEGEVRAIAAARHTGPRLAASADGRAH